MQPCPALVEPGALFNLLVDLEPDFARHEVDEMVGLLAGPSHDDPGETVGLLVPGHLPSGGARVAERWLHQVGGQVKEMSERYRVGRLVVIWPGELPETPHRTRLGAVSLRVVSAAHYIWVERLRIYSQGGQLSEDERRLFIDRFCPRWSTENERSYTEPALTAVRDGDVAAESARTQLLTPSPDLPAGQVTLIFGPGGIGKTFFLRRLSSNFAKAAKAEATVGLPVFAELPVLLHEDALETFLSNAGINLPMPQIRALVEHGVVVPVLDALDELVRGQARDGTRDFLSHIGSLARRAKVLMSSRDYYLNLDPLVQQGLAEAEVDTDPAELKIGYFSQQGRRRYIQLRTALNEAGAARWAGQLEEQSRSVLSELTDDDVESLIGHPLFLEAFCQMILAHPKAERARRADEFTLSSPNVFGEIVDSVLVREAAKFQPAWDKAFEGKLVGDFRTPFEPGRQRQVLKRLILLAAEDGGGEVLRRQRDNQRLRELRHGVFTFTKGVPTNPEGDAKQSLREILREQLGEPRVADGIDDDEANALRDDALDQIADFYAQHTLSDTQPDPPAELVFATRHRAYFDYLLADALLQELADTLSRPGPDAAESFVLWCLEHHIFERFDRDESEPPYASCLDFVLWHRESMERALELIDGLFQEPEALDATNASYIASLALAVSLRAGVQAGRTLIADREFLVAKGPLEVLPSVVPQISACDVERCSLPMVSLASVPLKDVTMTELDMLQLELADSSWTEVIMDDVEAEALAFRGTVHLSRCRLDLRVPLEAISVDPGAELSASECQLSPALHEAIKRASELRPNSVRMNECQVIEEVTETEISPGRLFLNKLLAVARRHGHNEYGVYDQKLRGVSNATKDNFADVIKVLVKHEIVVAPGAMIYLTDRAAEERYYGRQREGVRTFEDVAEFWSPVVEDLDRVLG